MSERDERDQATPDPLDAALRGALQERAMTAPQTPQPEAWNAIDDQRNVRSFPTRAVVLSVLAVAAAVVLAVVLVRRPNENAVSIAGPGTELTTTTTAPATTTSTTNRVVVGTSTPPQTAGTTILTTPVTKPNAAPIDPFNATFPSTVCPSSLRPPTPTFTLHNGGSDIIGAQGPKPAEPGVFYEGIVVHLDWGDGQPQVPITTDIDGDGVQDVVMGFACGRNQTDSTEHSLAVLTPGDPGGPLKLLSMQVGSGTKPTRTIPQAVGEDPTQTTMVDAPITESVNSFTYSYPDKTLTVLWFQGLLGMPVDDAGHMGRIVQVDYRWNGNGFQIVGGPTVVSTQP